MRAQSSLHRSSAGFSMIELIIVVALIAFVYAVALPQFSLRTGTEVADRVNTLAGDVRSAADLAILTGKTYRMVFLFNSGDYELQEADRNDVVLGSEKLDRDPTEQEEKDELTTFNEKFVEYTDLAGQSVTNPKSDKQIAPTSPVVAAKARLHKPAWTKVENLEWTHRSLGPHLMIKDMQAEHHGHKQDLAELGPDARGMLYFFPSGNVERAVIHIFYKKDEMTPDETVEPYSLITNPYEGTGELSPGYLDIDVHEDKDG